MRREFLLSLGVFLVVAGVFLLGVHLYAVNDHEPVAYKHFSKMTKYLGVTVICVSAMIFFVVYLERKK